MTNHRSMNIRLLLKARSIEDWSRLDLIQIGDKLVATSDGYNVTKGTTYEVVSHKTPLRDLLAVTTDVAGEPYTKTQQIRYRRAFPESWPKMAGALGESPWNTQFDAFVDMLNEYAQEQFWVHDHELKYLNMRIDTRGNRFMLYLVGHKGEGVVESIDPMRVVEAAAKVKVLL